MTKEYQDEFDKALNDLVNAVRKQDRNDLNYLIDKEIDMYKTILDKHKEDTLNDISIRSMANASIDALNNLKEHYDKYVMANVL